jgi:hypothetical protein
MLKYDVFLHWALVAKCISQFFKCLNVKSGSDPPQAVSQPVRPSVPQMTVSIILLAEDIVLACFYVSFCASLL